MKKKIIVKIIIIAIIVEIITIVLLNVIHGEKKDKSFKVNNEIVSQIEKEESNSISNKRIYSNIINEINKDNVIDESFFDDDEVKQELNENTVISGEKNIINNYESEITEAPIEENVQKEYIQGMEVAGHMKIPKFNVDAPIFSYANKYTLDISMGVAYGNLNEKGNTTIFGHAYKNYPFEKISQLEIGDTINITDSSKNEIIYEVYDKQSINSNDATYMFRDTFGAREITMQTGESDTTRLIVLAREIKK